MACLLHDISMGGLMRTDPGYDPHNVLTAKVQLPLNEFASRSGEPNGYGP